MYDLKNINLTKKKKEYIKKNLTYLRTKSSATLSKLSTAALAASGDTNAFDTLDLNLDQGSPCLLNKIKVSLVIIQKAD